MNHALQILIILQMCSCIPVSHEPPLFGYLVVYMVWQVCDAPLLARSGGSTLKEALEGVALAMFNYMTPLANIKVDETLTRWTSQCCLLQWPYDRAAA